MNRLYKNTSFFAGPKYIQQPIEDLSGVKPLAFAKPGLLLNEYITKKYNIVNPSRVLFIGDKFVYIHINQ